MNIPQSIRARCSFLSDQLRLNIPLDAQQRNFLSKALKAISEGEDPLIVFGAVRSKGRRNIDVLTQEKIRKVLQRVMSDILIAKNEGNRITIATAIRNNVTFANELWGYQSEYPVISDREIRRWWDNKKYRHFKSPVFDPFQSM